MHILPAIKESKIILKNSSNRSNDKLYPLHNSISESYKDKYYTIYGQKCPHRMDGYGNPINKIDPKTGLSIPEKTKIINGQSYIKGQESKSTDGVVGVSRSDIHILNQITNNEGVIFFKSIESSLEKNGANYVNTFLGETVRKTPYYQAVGHFIVVPRSTPVTNKKGKSESPDKMLQYIVNWITNTNYSRSAYTIPDAICICIFDYDQNGNVVLYSDDGINNIVKPCPWILDIDFFFEIMVKLMGK